MVDKRLLNLLKSEDWDGARGVLEGAVRAVAAEAAGCSDDGGDGNEGSVSSREAAEAGLRGLVEAEDSSGQIPLHIAIWKKAPDDLILSLMDALESTVTARTKNRSTPLHFATFYSSSAVVVEALLRRYPLALDEMNEYQVTPRTYDLGKLDADARELLMRPTGHWMEVFVRDSLDERVKLRRLVGERDGRIAGLERCLAEVEAEASSSSAERGDGEGGRRRGGGAEGGAEDGIDVGPEPGPDRPRILDELRASLADAERENAILRRGCTTCGCPRRVVPVWVRGGDDDEEEKKVNGGIDDVHDEGGRTSSSDDADAADEKSLPAEMLSAADGGSIPRRSGIGRQGEEAKMVHEGHRRRRMLASSSCTISSSSLPSAPPSNANANANATLERRIEYLEERLSEAIGALDRKISLANNGGGTGTGVDAFIDDGGWVITNAAAAV